MAKEQSHKENDVDANKIAKAALLLKHRRSSSNEKLSKFDLEEVDIFEMKHPNEIKKGEDLFFM